MQANKHTIILMQTSHNRATRTFMDYDSISQAMDGTCPVVTVMIYILNFIPFDSMPFKWKKKKKDL